MSRDQMTREERIAALHALIERQMEARKREVRSLRELDEAIRWALAEYMDLVAPRRPRDGRGTP